jgi:bacteriorhodopsin
MRGGRNGIGVVGLLTLSLLPPAIVAWHAWRRGTDWYYIALAVFVSLALTIMLIFLSAQIWWVDHGCET